MKSEADFNYFAVLRIPGPDIINVLLGFIFGAVASHSLVTIAKFGIGRLRPHFMDVCRPDFSKIDCGTPMHPSFVTNYTCLGNVDFFKVSESKGL